MSKNDNCHDLKNLQYKTLIDKKSKLEVFKTDEKKDNIANIENLLEKEKILLRKNSWNKLDKTHKIKYLNKYVDNNSNYNLTLTEKKEFKKYLINMINKKQLQKKTDITYDKNEDKITNIPIIIFNKETRKFTQKRADKRSSTSSSLSKLKTSKPHNK